MGTNRFQIAQATVTQITPIITWASIIIAFIVGDSVKTSANIKAQKHHDRIFRSITT